MNTEEIIDMARQAGFTVGYGSPALAKHEAFAKLVDAKATAREREACAKMCDGISLRASDRHDAMTDDRDDEPILYMSGKELGAKSCADAIRNRGDL